MPDHPICQAGASMGAVNKENEIGQAIKRLPWPLFTIDFEASSLDRGTYPIEVGVCRWQQPDSCIEGWSTLIKPIPDWAAQGSWSTASAAVHRIERAQIQAGMNPTGTIIALNTILGDRPAYCDGGPHDLNWARMLARASQVPATFKIGDFDMLTGVLPPLAYTRMVHWLDHTSPLHRARDDAERLMKALARGLGIKRGISMDIEI
jgi:hypothetical protein